MPQQRGYTAGMFDVELGGVTAGLADSVEGGDAFGDVVVEKAGTDLIVHKHLGGVKYEDLTFVVGTGMSPGFFDWIASTLSRKYQRKDGAVSFRDYRGVEQQRLEWFHGVISEVGFPAVEGDSKNAVRLTVKVAVEHTKYANGSGKAAALTGTKQKQWFASNYRLSIEGVDCSGVFSVGALTITQTFKGTGIGEVRDREAEPTGLDIPNLVVSVVEERASDFLTWHQDFVVDGNNDQAHEKHGTLEYLGPDLNDVLLTLTFSGLGILRASRAKTVAGAAAVATVEVEMYCEDISLSYPKPVAVTSGGATPAQSADPGTILANALKDVLGPKLVAGAGTPGLEQVAARLRATSTPAESPNGDAIVERGRQLGADWAREHATLDELQQLAEVRDSDWTALTLGEGHSLVAALQEAGVVPDAHDGPLALERDSFVDELVEGAAEVYDDVRPHLEGASPAS